MVSQIFFTSPVYTPTIAAETAEPAEKLYVLREFCV
jgi:hypothetical protein